MPDHVLSIV
jgi:hypothetical protein